LGQVSYPILFLSACALAATVIYWF